MSSQGRCKHQILFLCSQDKLLLERESDRGYTERLEGVAATDLNKHIES